MPCLIFVGAADADFVDQARRASEEMPGAALLVLKDVDHVTAHSQHEQVIPAVLRTLRAASPS